MGAIPLRAIVMVAVVTSTPFTAPTQVLLNADFDNKAIDVPIGTWGAALGEPVSV